MFIINDQSNYFEDELSESPIERIFMEEILKYLATGTEIGQQIEYSTRLGKFRVDFLIKKEAIEYAVELDGKEFHKISNDSWRDSFLLGENKIKNIIRFQGKDITYNLYECLYFMSKIFPETFSERGKLNLSNLIEPINRTRIDHEIQEFSIKKRDYIYFEKVEYELEEVKKHPPIDITIKGWSNSKNWQQLYNFAVKNEIYNIEELNKKYYGG